MCVCVCVCVCIHSLIFPYDQVSSIIGLLWLSCFHSNLGWLYYGTLKRDQTIVLVNIIGALLQILYIIVYFYYTKQKVSGEA